MTKAEAITAIFGRWNAVTVYPESVDGLQKFLEDSGVINFSAKEITSNKNFPGLYICPTRIRWYRATSLLLVLEKCRALSGSPLPVRYWWRPENYGGIDINRKSGGYPDSDHIDATAMDVDFASPHHLRDALETILIPLWKLKSFDLSLGVGNVRLHLGVCSKMNSKMGRQRSWLYTGVEEGTAKLLKSNGVIK